MDTLSYKYTLKSVVGVQTRKQEVQKFVSLEKMTEFLSSLPGQTMDPDETAHHEPSHLDLHRLQKYLS